MKQSVKLPGIETKEPLLNEMRHLIKNTEDIKGMLQSLWQDQSTPAVRGIDRVVEEVRKQRRVMGRLVQNLETEAKSIKAEEMTVSNTETVRNSQDHTPPRAFEPTDRSSHKREDEPHLRKILQEHQKMLKAQTDILTQTKKLIERVGTVGVTMTPLAVAPSPQIMTKQPTRQPQAITKSQQAPKPEAQKPPQQVEQPAHNSVVDTFESQLKHMQEMLQSNPNDIRCVQEVVGSLFRQSTIRAFEDYSRGMPEEDMKTQFAEEILNRYRQYVIAVQSLKGYDVATIERLENLFEKLGRKTIEFLLFKYPQSKKKISDAALARHIKQVRKLTHPQYDILRNGKIDLNLSNLNQGLNKQLKVLINGLIKETNRYYETYKKYMTDIFLEQEMQDPSFSFLIGRKIKETTQEYTDDELNTPGFFIKSNEILRILIKWIEELISWFTDPNRTLDNQFGFKYEDIDEKLGVDSREDMWDRFQKNYANLKQDFEEAELFIRRTLSSIIGISRNEIVGKYTLEPMAFISRKDILIPMICKYVSDTLQCYAVQLINACLTRTNEIREEYEYEHSQISGFSLYSFTVNDLLRCKCTGKKDRIMKVYDKLRELEQKDDLSIIMVKNRLSGPTQDILITYKLKNCFLLCEIQLALSTTNEEINDHFNHFLYEQHRSRHGIICELAMMLNTLDPRQKYFRNNKLSFLSQEKAFALQDNKIVCIANPNNKLELYKNDIPYMCGQCCRFIDAFRYYMASKECKGCFKKLCPPCYMRMLPNDVAITAMLEPLPMLKGYFTASSTPMIEFQPKKLQEEIIKQLIPTKQSKNPKEANKDPKDSKNQNYLLIVVYKNNLYNWSLRLIKIYEESYEEEKEDQEQYDEDGNSIEIEMVTKVRRHILEAFTNKTVDLVDYDSSMVLFMKPTAPVEKLTFEEINSIVAKVKGSKSSEEPFETMYELQEEYYDDQEYNVFMIKNAKTGRKMIVDYSLSNDEIEEMMSQHRFRALVKAENNAKNGRLVLKDLALDLNILDDLKLPDSITYLEMASCYEPESVDAIEYSKLNSFKALECLYIQDLDSYTKHEIFTFNEDLLELGLSTGVLSTFDNIPIESKKLRVLDLSNNKIAEPLPKLDLPLLSSLELQSNYITNISSLDKCNLPLLDKLDLTGNRIEGNLPVLNLPKLRVLVLDNNTITNVDNLLKSKMELLKMLYLKNNNIAGKVPNLGHFPRLILAELQNNKFEQLPPMRSESLQKLYLERNHLKGPLPKLQLPLATEVRLSENMFSDVEALKECDLSNLQILSLLANPFEKFPALAFAELCKLDIEPEKMRFKVDPNRQNDNNDVDNLECGVCEQEILTFGADYDLERHHYICKQCQKKADPSPKIILVCMVLGEDLLRYA